MLGLVLAKTPVRFAWVPGYADYYPEAPGGLAAGRSIEPVPLDGRRVLGAELAHLARPYLPSPVAITQAEYRWLSLGRHPRGVRAAVRVAGRAARARLLGQRVLSMGQALAAGLRAGLVASGVPVWLDTPLAGLEVAGGRVTGVRATRDGEPALIRARRGVLIATGGFERDEQMRRRYSARRSGPSGRSARPATPGTGSGQAIICAVSGSSSALRLTRSSTAREYSSGPVWSLTRRAAAPVSWPFSSTTKATNSDSVLLESWPPSCKTLWAAIIAQTPGQSTIDRRQAVHRSV